MKHKLGKIEGVARRRLVSQAPSRLLPPYKGEGFWKGVRGWSEIGWNLLIRNSIYNSKQFFEDLLPDVPFQDLKTPVAAVFMTSSQQAVLAISDNEENPMFNVPQEAPEIPIRYEGKAADVARASSSLPFIMSRVPMTVGGIKTYSTDGGYWRGLPCQFLEHPYRLALSTRPAPEEELKQLKPDWTGWWGIGVPYQVYTSFVTMLSGVTAKDISGFMIRGDGNEETYEFCHALECGNFRKENEINISWLNVGGHTPKIVGALFDYGATEAEKFWNSELIKKYHKDIKKEGLAVCMTGGGGDGYAQCGFLARLRDLIGRPYVATAGLSAGSINAIFFSWLEEHIKELNEVEY